KQVEDLRHWLGRLPNWELIKKKGRTRATEYFIDPELLRKLDFKGGTTLKGIESHRLQELILKDLEIYKSARIDELHSRIGKEIPLRRVQYEIHQLMKTEKIGKNGYGRWTKYLYTQNVSE
ncbi:MAG: ATP-dependent DNA helicase, partial [Acidobacteriota bacterium]